MKHSTANLLGLIAGSIAAIIFLGLTKIPVNAGFFIGYLTGGIMHHIMIRKYLNE